MDPNLEKPVKVDIAGSTVLCMTLVVIALSLLKISVELETIRKLVELHK